MRRALAALLLLCATSACLAPAGAAERATDAARELNLATRFGRMDIAVGRAARGARDAFVARRAGWGKAVRVLDIELAGLEMTDQDSAIFLVDVQWVPVDESTVRTTRVAQSFRDEKGSWQLVREKRIAGDLGLFGEPIAAIERKQGSMADRFATKIIR
jgi:hypothetical protein